MTNQEELKKLEEEFIDYRNNYIKKRNHLKENISKENNKIYSEFISKWVEITYQGDWFICKVKELLIFELFVLVFSDESDTIEFIERKIDISDITSIEILETQDVIEQVQDYLKTILTKYL